MDRNWTDDLKVGDEIEFVSSDRGLSSKYVPGAVFTVYRTNLVSASLSKDGVNCGLWDHSFLLREFKPLKKSHKHLKGVARFFKGKDL